MAWDWNQADHIAGDVLIAAGLAVLIMRQFLWRSAELSTMLRLPSILIALGAVSLVVELGGGPRWTPGDWLILAELALVALTGTVMGRVTHFRSRDGRLQYRLTTAGLLLWLLFIAIRIGSFAVAARLGAHVAEASGTILILFGANRLAATIIVRHRARALFAHDDDDGVPALPGTGRVTLASPPREH